MADFPETQRIKELLREQIYPGVVVKVQADDAFVITAYLTDTVKKGKQRWPREN